MVVTGTRGEGSGRHVGLSGWVLFLVGLYVAKQGLGGTFRGVCPRLRWPEFFVKHPNPIQIRPGTPPLYSTLLYAQWKGAQRQHRIEAQVYGSRSGVAHSSEGEGALTMHTSA